MVNGTSNVQNMLTMIKMETFSKYAKFSFIYYFIHAITLERFHIVTHSYEASFSIKNAFL